MRPKKHPCESCKTAPMPNCKECRNIRNKRWYQANPEKVKEYEKRRYQASPEKMKEREKRRELLFDEIDSLRKGVSNPQRANAVAKTASQIINSVKLELDYARHLSSMGDSGNIKSIPILTLGTDTKKGGTHG